MLGSPDMYIIKKSDFCRLMDSDNPLNKNLEKKNKEIKI